MDFVIKEKVSGHGVLHKIIMAVKDVLMILLFLVLVPFLLIGWILGKFKKEENLPIINDWDLFKQLNGLKLYRKCISEDDIPMNLDYPEETNDIYLCHYKSEPEIPALSNKYFDILNFVESDNGVYAVSFNEKGHGMTLWFIDRELKTMNVVKELESQWWGLSVDKNGVVRLQASDKKNKYDYTIMKNCP